MNGGITSAGKAFGGALINGKFVPNATGELVRECGPDGAIVEHRVRKSAYVHERIHSSKKLADELYDAAEKFRMDFEKAQLAGNYVERQSRRATTFRKLKRGNPDVCVDDDDHPLDRTLRRRGFSARDKYGDMIPIHPTVTELATIANMES